jgi:hypothetical protein
MQRLIRAYREETGEREVDMHEVAGFAVNKGWPLPTPRSAIDMLADQFTQAAREEIRHDQVTGKPYRANHALLIQAGQLSFFKWFDIDEATRPQMLKSAVKRREQMVDDGLQLSFDLDHWNRINPDDEPIELPMDLGPDIEWRKNAPDDDDKAA